MQTYMLSVHFAGNSQECVDLGRLPMGPCLRALLSKMWPMEQQGQCHLGAGQTRILAAHPDLLNPDLRGSQCNSRQLRSRSMDVGNSADVEKHTAETDRRKQTSHFRVVVLVIKFFLSFFVLFLSRFPNHRCLSCFCSQKKKYYTMLQKDMLT